MSLQVELCAEELNNNVPSHIMLLGHLKAVMKQVIPAGITVKPNVSAACS